MTDVAPDPRRGEKVTTVYLAGLLQGIALVTFPAAASVFTDPADYGLSSSQYGALFVPQAITAIAASLLGGRLAGRIGLDRVLWVGLGANALAMALLVISGSAMGTTAGYLLLLAATASLGTGFGLTVPTLNAFTADFFPERVDRATLYLNALLGLGTFLSPVIAALFLALGIWWGLPLLVGAALLVELVWALRLPMATGRVAGPGEATGDGRSGRPGGRVWLFVGFALLYGVVETVNGNWSTVYMGADVGASASAATLALAAFWGMVTVGRLLFAVVEARLPQRTTYRILPFVAAVALVLVALVPRGDVGLAVLGFGLAGLGCSALLPLTISFGERELVVLGAAAAGTIFASYQVGYGIAAFGVGPLEDAGLTLSTIYLLTAGIAVVLAVLSMRLVRSGPGTSIQPRPVT